MDVADGVVLCRDGDRPHLTSLRHIVEYEGRTFAEDVGSEAVDRVPNCARTRNYWAIERLS